MHGQLTIQEIEVKSDNSGHGFQPVTDQALLCGAIHFVDAIPNIASPFRSWIAPAGRKTFCCLSTMSAARIGMIVIVIVRGVIVLASR
jgi:hypothetical protein